MLHTPISYAFIDTLHRETISHPSPKYVLCIAFAFDNDVCYYNDCCILTKILFLSLSLSFTR